ncbi:MAG TPA: TatD family hydrolase [Treponemataceae bacterium]|nr:TatD family hydrolase [Treponemataceae bacterium]
MYTDAHLHLKDYVMISGNEPIIGENDYICASAHKSDEFIWQENFALKYPGQVLLSFGIHPQNPDNSEFSFLEDLVRSKRISAIGESGFDLYSKEFSLKAKSQELVWNIQLDLAIKAQLPLVIHCRKALHLLFADSKRLSLLPAVVFHGWSGSAVEAQSFLSRNVQAFFCVGKALLRGDRSLLETIKNIPMSQILTETDAPYMTLKGESFSMPSDIVAVSKEAALIAGYSVEGFCFNVKENFKRAFSM